MRASERLSQLDLKIYKVTICATLLIWMSPPSKRITRAKPMNPGCLLTLQCCSKYITLITCCETLSTDDELPFYVSLQHK
jgi:hypothetical protein